jgi:cytochrome c6
MNKRLVQVIIFVMIVLLLVPLLATPALGAELESGAQLFEAHCAGCHLNGGNIIRRGKNLKKRAMEKNGYTNTEAIAQLITQGKGNMSAYAEKLTPDEIQAVAQYVLAQSQVGWHN